MYGLAAASAAPILFGVLYKNRISAPVIFISALLGLLTHLLLNLYFGVANPAVSATYAIIASIVFVLSWFGLRKIN